MLNNIQTSTQNDLNVIFNHIKLCIFKNEQEALSGENSLSITNTNKLISAVLNISNNSDFSTEQDRLDYIAEYNNINNYIDSSGNLLPIEALNVLYEQNPYYLNLKVKYNIDLTHARLANDFDILYEPKFISSSILSYFKDLYTKNLKYLYSTIYVKGMETESNYRNLFLSISVFYSIMDLFTEKLKNPFDIKILDDFTLDNFMYSFGIPYFVDLPLKFKKLLFRNLNKLIINKGTTQCLIDILEIYDFQNIDIYKYYLVKRFTNNNDKLNSLSLNARFYIININEKSIQAAIKKDNYFVETFNEVVTDDVYWESSKNEIESYEFDFENSKYIGITANYNLFEEIINMTYCLNFIREVETYFPNKNFMLFSSAEIGNNQYQINDLILAMNILICRIYNITDNINYSLNNKKIYSFKNNKSYTSNPVVNLNNKLIIDQNILNESLTTNFNSKINLESLINKESDYSKYKILLNEYNEKFYMNYNLNMYSPYTSYTDYLRVNSIDLYNYIENNSSSLELKQEALDVLLNILIEYLADINFNLVLNADILVLYIEYLTKIIEVFKSYTVTLKKINLRGIINEKNFFKLRESIKYKNKLSGIDSLIFSDRLDPTTTRNKDSNNLIFSERLEKRIIS